MRDAELAYFDLALKDSADLRKLAAAELSRDDAFVKRVPPGILRRPLRHSRVLASRSAPVECLYSSYDHNGRLT